jgi:hypothetical protein
MVYVSLYHYGGSANTSIPTHVIRFGNATNVKKPLSLEDFMELDILDISER